MEVVILYQAVRLGNLWLGLILAIQCYSGDAWGISTQSKCEVVHHFIRAGYRYASLRSVVIREDVDWRDSFKDTR